MLDEHMRETHSIYKCSMYVFTSSSERGLKVNTTKSHTKYKFNCYKYDYSSYIWDDVEAYERRTLTSQNTTQNK